MADRPIFGPEIVRAAQRDGVTVRQALDARIRLELLALAAEEALPAAPASVTGDEREAKERAAVERMIERDVEPGLRRSAISEPELRVAYERARKRFVHGRLVQVAVLCVFTGARLAAEPRARAERNARLLRDYVTRHSGTRTAADFEAISKDPEWMQRNVSFTTVWQDLTEPFPAVVGTAVSRLARPGDTTDLVGDDSGYYIARHIAERPPEDISFSEARPTLEAEIYLPWRRQKFLRLTLALAKQHEVEAYPENFAQLVEPPSP